MPTSASRLNLVEVWFCHLTKQQIRRGDFLGVPDLIDAITAYIHHYNQQAGPFIWTAPAERILEKVMKCRAISESLHQVPRRIPQRRATHRRHRGFQ